MSIFKSKFLLGMMVAAFALVGAATVSQAASCDLGTSTLKVGSKSAAVMCLQQTLNEKGFTVATSGAGSVGNESSTFGPKTGLAVKAFQAQNGLTADGVFGAKSRAALMSVTTTTTTTTTTTGTGALCPNGMLLSNNCAAAAAPAAGTLCPNGNLLSNNCAVSTVVATSNGEGSVTIDYSAVPAANVVINKGQENQNAAGITVKATGSDMKVSRVWLDFTGYRPWLAADTASLMDGSTVLATIPLSSSAFTEVTAGSKWQLQFNSLNVTVPVGTTKTLMFTLGRPTLTSSYGILTIATTSSVRATDAANFSNTYTLAARTISLPNTNATAGTLTATLNASSPATQSIAGLSTTAGTLTAVKLMDFDLKATDGPINVTDISGTISTGTSTCTAAQCIASIELRDGSNVLASLTGASTFDFGSSTSISVDIAKDTTKTLSIWVNVNHIASSYVVAGDNLAASVTAVTGTSGTDFTTADCSANGLSPTCASAVTSNVMYLYRYAPTFTLGAVSALSNAESTSNTINNGANYSLQFTVTAPSGSDIYVDTTSTVAVVAYNASTAGFAPTVASVGGTLVTSAQVSGTASTGNSSGYDKVTAGSSRTWTVTGYIPHGTGAGYVGMQIRGIKWNATDSTSGTTAQTWGLADFKTPTIYVTAN